MSQAARVPSEPGLERVSVGRRIRVPKTGEIIAGSLRRKIIRRELAAGDALPPESALMEEFGVSRPTLREAFRVLEAEGLITIRRGINGGARVSVPSFQVAARYAGLILEYQGATLADVYRASAVIEPPCVRAVSAEHTAEDITRLEEAIAAEEAVLDDLPALVQVQDDFHSLIVELAGNPTLSLFSGMLRMIVDRANASYLAADPTSETRRTNAMKAHRTHAKIVKLIKEGKAEEAEKLWARHVAAADDAVNAAGAKTVLDLLG